VKNRYSVLALMMTSLVLPGNQVQNIYAIVQLKRKGLMLSYLKFCLITLLCYNKYARIGMRLIMNEKASEKSNDGSMSESYIRFRISLDDKEKIRSYFGSYSAIRDYALKTIEDKGKMKRNEVNK